MACLDQTPVALDALLERLDMPAMTVKSILTRLTIQGLIVNHPGGRVSRK